MRTEHCAFKAAEGVGVLKLDVMLKTPSRPKFKKRGGGGVRGVGCCIVRGVDKKLTGGACQREGKENLYLPQSLSGGP